MANPDIADISDLLRSLLFILEGGEPAGDQSTWRSRLTALLTARSTAGIPKEAWPLLAEVWRRELIARPCTHAVSLARLTQNGRWTDRVSLWQGDITRLETGAIVNAANSGLTGCYIPFHSCVDNAIHTAAGPWLREVCEKVMAARGRPEPVATATVTGAFYLPCRYVLHTVGPTVSSGDPSPRDEAALYGCYHACLVAALELGIDSIAFCAISTGIFGYPKSEAARIALRAIRDFFAANEGAPLHVILVAYTQSDEAVYRAAFREISA